MSRAPATGRSHSGGLPDVVRTAIEARSGAISQMTPVGTGRNHQLAVVAYTSSGAVFVKGLRADHPTAWTQQVEARINPYLGAVAPHLRWQTEADGWHLLAFDHVAGHPADFTPGSADLPKVADALRHLSELPRPDVPIKRIVQRWAAHAEPGQLALLADDRLLHTDLNPGNILVTADGARIVDWAWPAVGAGWIDSACLALWLIAEGHTPEHAEAWAQAHTGLAAASKLGLDAFVAVNRRLWRNIADNDPQPWKQQIATAAHHWNQHRCNQPA